MSPGLELVCVLLLSLGTARAQIPIQCGTRAHVERGECCPVFWGDGSPCGTASGRGSCRDVTGETPREREERAREQANTRDFRLWWPTYFFSRACACQGNFGGADCGECAHGWRGERCQERRLAVRRDVSALSAAEREGFLRRLRQSKVTTSQRYVIYASQSSALDSAYDFRRASVYDVANWVHYICAKPIRTSAEPYFGHRSAAFLSWHRMYLLHLEVEIRNVTGEDNFTMPFWAWAGKVGCDVCTDQLFGSSQAGGRLSGQFSSWQVYCPNDGAEQFSMRVLCPPVPGGPVRRLNRFDERFDSLPTVQDVAGCLRITAFDTAPYALFSANSFRSAIEGYSNPLNPSEQRIGMHNLIHVFCGGTLNDIFEASNDPLFGPVHAYIDMIFERWIRIHGGNQYPTGNRVPYGHRANDYIVPFVPLYRNRDMMQSCTNLGYDYDFPNVD